MVSDLRLLAVHVEEPKPRSFEWVIMERGSRDQWAELDRAAKGLSTYKGAMSSGLIALEKMIDDLNVGPRREAKLGSDPPQAPASAQSDHDVSSPASKPKDAAYFGFGPVR